MYVYGYGLQVVPALCGAYLTVASDLLQLQRPYLLPSLAVHQVHVCFAMCHVTIHLHVAGIRFGRAAIVKPHAHSAPVVRVLLVCG